MGAGIAQVAACSGLSVICVDSNRSALERARDTMMKSLTKLAQKGKLEASPDEIVAKLTMSDSLQAGAQADLVIEAVFENLDVKCELLAKLDALVNSETLLVTNTSSLSVTAMARATKADRWPLVVGMHFFNPVPLMRLVEVIRSPFTSKEAYSRVWALAQMMGKTPVEAKDTPGFLFNRLILPYLNEAIWAVYEGVGTVVDLDQAMVLGGNMPIGPLALLDMIGLDVQLHALSAIFDETGDPKYRPCPLNKQMVRAGFLGRKSGRGFYEYQGQERKAADLSLFRF